MYTAFNSLPMIIGSAAIMAICICNYMPSCAHTFVKMNIELLSYYHESTDCYWLEHHQILIVINFSSFFQLDHVNYILACKTERILQ